MLKEFEKIADLSQVSDSSPLFYQVQGIDDEWMKKDERFMLEAEVDQANRDRFLKRIEQQGNYTLKIEDGVKPKGDL